MAVLQPKQLRSQIDNTLRPSITVYMKNETVNHCTELNKQ